MSANITSRYWEAISLLEHADEIHDAAKCQAAIRQMADEITRDLSETYPLVLSVMGGAVVFTGKLLPMLRFPLDFDYIHITRYGDRLQGGTFHWLRQPQHVEGRHILVLDDILDEGQTMHAICEYIIKAGALSCHSAVFLNKLTYRPKPVQADYIGLNVPDRYVFGYGMDAQGMWRNLDAIYAIQNK